MESDRIKWNKRFGSEDLFLGERPSPFLVREMERIKQLAPGKRALDIACGEGRNSIFLAQRGFVVTGLDISDAGIAKGTRLADAAGVQVEFRQTDLEGYRMCERFDLIINFNFLLRDLIPEEVAALTPGGLLLFDTIMESPDLLANHTPGFLLVRGELARIFAGHNGQIMFEEEVEEGEMPTSRLMFRKSS